MASGQQSFFEIHVRVGGHWSVYSAARERSQAVQFANSLLSMNQFDAVKVTEEDDRGRDKCVYEKEGQGAAGKAITIMPVDEAPLCRDLADFYRFESRRTAARVLRRYLDRTGITVLELMHHHGHMKWLTRNNETLVIQAVQNVAAVQSRANNLDQTKRMDALYKIVDEITERAKQADAGSEHYRRLKSQGIQALYDAAVNGEAEGRAFRVRAALAFHLGEAKGWERKVELLLKQAETGPGIDAMAFIDEAMAEILDGADAIKELLGYQRTLADALHSLIAVGCGRYKPTPRAGRLLERLSRIMARFEMPLTRGVMVDRVQREVGGVKPLSKEGEVTEEEAFTMLVRSLIENKLIAEGGGLSEAATLRAKMVFSHDSLNESSELAIDSMLRLLPTKGVKVQYLLDLVGSDFGAKNQDHIIRQLARIVRNLRSVTALVEAGAGRDEIIEAAARIRDRLLSTKLPDHWRLRFARTIYNLLIDYRKGEVRPPDDDDADEDDEDDDVAVGDAATAAVASAPERPSATAAAAQPAPASWSEAADKNGEVTMQTDSGAPRPALGSRTIAAGEYIFREGDMGNEAYLIKAGVVEISRRAGTKDVVIAEAGRGSIIGEMALIDAKPRMATARAKKRTLLTVIPSDALRTRLERLEKFDPVLRRMVDMFVQRMRDHPIIEK